MLRQWIKRCVSMAACMAMLIPAVPVQAENNNGLEYKIVNEEAVITGYTGTDGIVNIPDTIDGYPVTKIDRSAFEGTDITDVTIPAGLKSIGYLAFGNCTSLKYMEINAVNLDDCSDRSVMGHDDVFAAFYNAGSPDGFEVVFTDGVYRIPAFLFATSDEGELGTYCKISKVTISNSIMKMGLSAFDNCHDLMEVIYDGPKSEWEGFITVGNVGRSYIFLNQGTVTFLRPEPTPAPDPTPTPTPRPEEIPVEMHRVYNPYSGEHFYTANVGEKDDLERIGWIYEGVGWVAPKLSKTPVYRLYNRYSGDHHYTMNAKEKEALVKIGWTDEGIGWYSDDARGTPLYREYNPNMKACNHNYTVNQKEHAALIKLGWKDEGIGWYGLKEEDPGFFIGSTEDRVYTNDGFALKTTFPDNWVLGKIVTENDHDSVAAQLMEGQECTIISAHVQDKSDFMQINLRNAGKIVHEEERGVIERKLDTQYQEQLREKLNREKMTDIEFKGVRTSMLSTMISGFEVSYTNPRMSTSSSVYKGHYRYLYILKGKTIMVIVMHTEGLNQTNPYPFYSETQGMFRNTRY